MRARRERGPGRRQWGFVRPGCWGRISLRAGAAAPPRLPGAAEPSRHQDHYWKSREGEEKGWEEAPCPTRPPNPGPPVPGEPPPCSSALCKSCPPAPPASSPGLPVKHIINGRHLITLSSRKPKFATHRSHTLLFHLERDQSQGRGCLRARGSHPHQAPLPSTGRAGGASWHHPGHGNGEKRLWVLPHEHRPAAPRAMVPSFRGGHTCPDPPPSPPVAEGHRAVWHEPLASSRGRKAPAPSSR